MHDLRVWEAQGPPLPSRVSAAVERCESTPTSGSWGRKSSQQVAVPPPLAAGTRDRLHSIRMRARSTPFALLLALLMVLWQPLCLCQGSEGEGGHSHGGVAHAPAASHHDGGGSLEDHDQANSAHDDDGGGAPCDDHEGGCDCSKLLATVGKATEAGAFGAHTPTHAAAVWMASDLTRPCSVERRGIREVSGEGLPPPPLLKLYRVLLI